MICRFESASKLQERIEKAKVRIVTTYATNFMGFAGEIGGLIGIIQGVENKDYQTIVLGAASYVISRIANSVATNLRRKDKEYLSELEQELDQIPVHQH